MKTKEIERWIRGIVFSLFIFFMIMPNISDLIRPSEKRTMNIEETSPQSADFNNIAKVVDFTWGKSEHEQMVDNAEADLMNLGRNQLVILSTIWNGSNPHDAILQVYDFNAMALSPLGTMLFHNSSGYNVDALAVKCIDIDLDSTKEILCSAGVNNQGWSFIKAYNFTGGAFHFEWEQWMYSSYGTLYTEYIDFDFNDFDNDFTMELCTMRTMYLDWETMQNTISFWTVHSSGLTLENSYDFHTGTREIWIPGYTNCIQGANMDADGNIEIIIFAKYGTSGSDDSTYLYCLKYTGSALNEIASIATGLSIEDHRNLGMEIGDFDDDGKPEVLLKFSYIQNPGDGILRCYYRMVQFNSINNTFTSEFASTYYTAGGGDVYQGGWKSINLDGDSQLEFISTETYSSNSTALMRMWDYNGGVIINPSYKQITNSTELVAFSCYGTLDFSILNPIPSSLVIAIPYIKKVSTNYYLSIAVFAHPNDTPVISQPSDRSFPLGSTGNLLQWNIIDSMYNNPKYNITNNASITPIYNANWDGFSTIMYSIDGIVSPGTYQILITYQDGLGSIVSDSVKVIVTAHIPILISPGDQTFPFGASNKNLTWVATDSYTNSPTYIVYKDFVAYDSGAWFTGVPIVINITGLAVGTYIFEIMAYDGIAFNNSDTVIVTVTGTNFPPVLNTPPDKSFTNGTLGNNISWSINDANTGVTGYEIRQNGTIIKTGTWVSGGIIFLNLDPLAPGLYFMTCIAFDGMGASANDTVMVTVLSPGNLPPTLTHPSDISFMAGIGIHILAWIITDANWGGPTYNIYRNGSLVQSNSWAPGQNKTYDVSGLGIGTWNITFFAYDGLGLWSMDQVWVVVTPVVNTPPTLTHPADWNFVVGSSLNLTWTITDLILNASQSNYVVYRNGTILKSGFWSNGSVIDVVLDGLAIGSYYYEIFVSDGFGLNNSDTVVITVTAVGNLAPTLTTPPDMTFTVGTSGMGINWTITDTAIGSTSYYIYRNGSMQASASWTSGQNISVNLNGLWVGIYNFTLIVYDGLGAVTSDTVWVNINPVGNNPPVLTSPSDQTFSTGETGHFILWIVNDGDVGTTSYNIYLLGSSIRSGTWVSGMNISLSLDSYGAGTYNFSIIVNDGLGGIVTDCVLVMIIAGGDIPTAPYLYPISPAVSTDGNVNLHWDPVADATIYFIYRNNQPITSISGMTPISYSYNTSYLDTNLPEATYYYVVVAHNSYGDSLMSNCESVIIDRPDPEPEPEPSDDDNNGNNGDDSSNPFGNVPGYPLAELTCISIAVIAVIVKLRKR